MKSAMLTGLVEKGYQAEKGFLAELARAEREAVGSLAQWTDRDIIAHNSYWRAHRAGNPMAVWEGRNPIQMEKI